MKTKSIRWQALAWTGDERFELTATHAGMVATGDLKGENDTGEPFDMTYRIELGTDWQIEHVTIQDNIDPARHLALRHQDGQWFDGALNHLKAFDGVTYIDISLTPFTNTLPIRREHFEGVRPRNITVLFIDLPSLTHHIAKQTYTKMGNYTYRFQTKEDPTFVADIVTDDEGLVVVYPGLFLSQLSKKK